jgi:hypothetical protein
MKKLIRENLIKKFKLLLTEVLNSPNYNFKIRINSAKIFEANFISKSNKKYLFNLLPATILHNDLKNLDNIFLEYIFKDFKTIPICNFSLNGYQDNTNANEQFEVFPFVLGCLYTYINTYNPNILSFIPNTPKKEMIYKIMVQKNFNNNYKYFKLGKACFIIKNEYYNLLKTKNII